MRSSPRFALYALITFLLVATAQAQTPTSGAALTIQDSNGNVLVNIYDSQLHSDTVLGSGCDPAGFVTDAYVLQGGSPTGCPPADKFEITDVATGINTFTPRSDNAQHQLKGAKDLAGFHIETHFVCVGKCATNVSSGNTKTFCNTNLTICINVVSGKPADNGFVVVTNNTGSPFTGTIALQGNPVAGGCAVAQDTWTTGLSTNQSIILAMGTQGTPAAPSTSDSSTCSGFNFDQVSPPQPPVLNPLYPEPVTFIFGKDNFTVTPAVLCPGTTCAGQINPGDILTFRPVPMPQGQFNLPGLTLTGSPFGNGQECATFASFSSPNVAQPNGICAEFQTHCYKSLGPPPTPCDDAESFSWRGVLNFTLDKYTTPAAGVGGVSFLGAQAVDCPQNSFNANVISSYTGSVPGTDPPLKPGGSGLNCFVATFDPIAAPIAPNAVAQVVTGFFSPVQPVPTISSINAGSNQPLSFSLTTDAGGPEVLGLNWCPGGPEPPPHQNVCQTTAAHPNPVPQPWIAFLRNPIVPTGALPNPNCAPVVQVNGIQVQPAYIGVDPTNSFMQPVGGQYKFNYATDSSEPLTVLGQPNCFEIDVRTDTGLFAGPLGYFVFTSNGKK